jgi:hypothetical protein
MGYICPDQAHKVDDAPTAGPAVGPPQVVAAGSSSDLVAPAAPAAVIKAPAPAAFVEPNPFRVGAAVAA